MSGLKRPQRGSAPEAALKRWSDDGKLYAEMDELSDASQPCSTAAGHPPSPGELRHREYAWRRKILEDAFLKKLLDGVLVASGRPNLSTTRDVIDPDQWDDLEIDYMLDEIVGHHLIYRKPEFFERSAIPLNIRQIPDWLPAPDASKGLPKLVHDENYTHVSVGEFSFSLGIIQSAIIAQLHAARLKDGEGWCVGKNLMKDAGSRQTKVSELFKNTPNRDKLIEGDTRGYFRLKAR